MSDFQLDRGCWERGCMAHDERDGNGVTISAKREQEPVAWMWKDGSLTSDPDEADGTWTKLYTAPPKREWVGLTEQDVHDAFQFTELVKQLSWGRERAEWCENFAAYIEAKLKEKNT